MITLVFLIGIMALLFVMSFFTKRRFGVLGLGLAAGMILSMTWAGMLTPLLEQRGLVIASLSLSLVVQAALILLPSFILLINGPSYSVLWQRILGSLAFAILGFTFLVQPLASIFQVDGPSYAFVDFVSMYSNIIIAVGIIAALADSVFLGQIKPKHKKH